MIFRDCTGAICYTEFGRDVYKIDPLTHDISVFNESACMLTPAVDMSAGCWWDLPHFDNALQAVKFIKSHVVL